MSVTYPSTVAAFTAALGDPSRVHFDRATWSFDGRARVMLSDDGCAIWVSVSAPDPMRPCSRVFASWTLAGKVDEDAPFATLDDAVAAAVAWVAERTAVKTEGTER